MFKVVFFNVKRVRIIYMSIDNAVKENNAESLLADIAITAELIAPLKAVWLLDLTVMLSGKTSREYLIR
jgi:hypothetical protein